MWYTVLRDDVPIGFVELASGALVAAPMLRLPEYETIGPGSDGRRSRWPRLIATNPAVHLPLPTFPLLTLTATRIGRASSNQLSATEKRISQCQRWESGKWEVCSRQQRSFLMAMNY